MRFLICDLLFLGLTHFVCRCKKRKQEKEREDYHYSGSDNDDEEPQVAGEPSSIMQQPGGDTLRRNFQQIQEGRTLSQSVDQNAAAAAANRGNQPQKPTQPSQQQQSRGGGDKEPQVEDPQLSNPNRQANPLNHRLIVVPDPHQQAQIAKRPLPPTPIQQAPQQHPMPVQLPRPPQQHPAPVQLPQLPQRISQNHFKPAVSTMLLISIWYLCSHVNRFGLPSCNAYM